MGLCFVYRNVTGERIQRSPWGLQRKEQGKSTADYQTNGG